jgi:hypothetical protein
LVEELVDGVVLQLDFQGVFDVAGCFGADHVVGELLTDTINGDCGCGHRIVLTSSPFAGGMFGFRNIEQPVQFSALPVDAYRGDAAFTHPFGDGANFHTAQGGGFGSGDL